MEFQITKNDIGADKTVVASYKWSTIRTGIKIYGQRLFLRVLEAVQYELEGREFTPRPDGTRGKDMRKLSVAKETNLLGEIELTMPAAAIMGNSRNLTEEVKEDIKNLMKLVFEYEDDKVWKAYPFLTSVKFSKGSRYFRVSIRPEVWEAMFDFSKGFKKFSLPKALSLHSVYSLRFYELISLQKTPLDFKIEDLRKMFKLEKKYPAVKDFIKKTVAVAKAELDACSPYTFDYESLYSTGGVGRPSITSIRFYPKYQRIFDTDALTEDPLLQPYLEGSLFPLKRAQEERLKYKFGITHQGIMNNFELFDKAVKNITDFDEFIERVAFNCDKKRPDSPAAYLINALKKELRSMGVDI